MKPDYDTNIARIAGNIAAGLASKSDAKGAGLFGAEGVAEWLQAITLLSVGLARSIVAEVKRTASNPNSYVTEAEADAYLETRLAGQEKKEP